MLSRSPESALGNLKLMPLSGKHADFTAVNSVIVDTFVAHHGAQKENTYSS